MDTIEHASAEGPPDVIAAVDLGSNSFHMIVARLHHGQLAILDRLRETVRLAEGLDGNGRLDAAAEQRALDCLRRFGQRLRDMQAHQVRVVGTSALRRAHDSGAFLAAAEAALGHPVEVVSGIEEARLIYVGVSHHVNRGDGPRLVVDIGGGSTELIIGEGDEPRRLESLKIGCVELTDRFFEGGRLSRRRFDAARMEARREMQPVIGRFRRLGWVHAVGSSGTIKTVVDVAHELGFTESGITPASVNGIMSRMIDARRLDALKLPGLPEDRAPIFAGGIAILAELLDGFGIDQLEVSQGAMREGLLYDMLGRLQDEDSRERSVRAMQRRYHVDEEQASRVEATAAALLDKVEQPWGLEPRYRQLLGWAAQLHEVGLDIAHSKYHHHGGYLLANADMPGFGRHEQQQLATLVARHRRKLDPAEIEALPVGRREPMLELIVLLRLAVLMNRGRSALVLPAFDLSTGRNRLQLKVPEAWLDGNPLTRADLMQEQVWLKAVGFELELEAVQEASAS